MRKILLIVASMFILSGCATWGPNKAVEATAGTVLIVSNQLQAAAERGIIDADTEYKLQSDLVNAIEILQGAGDITGCEGKTANECAQGILLAVEQVLKEAE